MLMTSICDEGVCDGDRRAAVAIGARSVTLWVGCGSHEGFVRKSGNEFLDCMRGLWQRETPRDVKTH